MRLPAMLLVVVAALFQGGCGELSRRSISDEDVLLASSFERISGVYRVMLKAESPYLLPSSTYRLLEELHSAGLHPGSKPATLSVSVLKDTVKISLKYQGKEISQTSKYRIVDNEVKLDVQDDDFTLILVTKFTSIAAGLGLRRNDGALSMRCRTKNVQLWLFVIPLIDDHESTVYFAPIEAEVTN